VFVFPGDEENQTHAGTNRGVRDVERGKSDFISAALLQVEINEIHDGVASGQQAIGEVPGDAAEDESECDLPGQRVRVEMVPREKQRDESDEGDERERAVVAAKQAPRSAGVAPMDEFEEAGNDNPFFPRFEQVQDEPLGKLVERENKQCERGDAAV